jgi:hypothetical protein
MVVVGISELLSGLRCVTWCDEVAICKLDVQGSNLRWNLGLAVCSI